MPNRIAFFLPLAFLAAACGSTPPDAAADDAPKAPPVVFQRNQDAKNIAPDVAPSPTSWSRVLGYVECDVITYREVLQRAGPELAQLENPYEKSRMEERALLDIVRERMIYRTALDAKVSAGRDEIGERRDFVVKGLAKNGGTLEAYLPEHDQT